MFDKFNPLQEGTFFPWTCPMLCKISLMLQEEYLKAKIIFSSYRRLSLFYYLKLQTKEIKMMRFV